VTVSYIPVHVFVMCLNLMYVSQPSFLTVYKTMITHYLWFLTCICFNKCPCQRSGLAKWRLFLHYTI